VESGFIMLKKHCFFWGVGPNYVNDSLLQLLLGVHLSLRVRNLRSCPAEWCLCSPENCGHAFSSRWLGPEFFLSSRSGMTILKWLASQFWVILMYPTLVPCNNGVQKTITLTFITIEKLLTCFQCYSLLFRYNITQHPSCTHVFVTQTCNKLSHWH